MGTNGNAAAGDGAAAGGDAKAGDGAATIGKVAMVRNAAMIGDAATGETAPVAVGAATGGGAAAGGGAAKGGGAATGDGKTAGPAAGQGGLQLILAATPDQAIRTALLEGLARANRLHVSEPDMQPLVILLRGTRGEQLYGGLWGRTAWGWLTIELLHIAEEMRGQGWGRRMMQAAEAEALRRNCHSAWVDTYSFQAPGFYERLGYSTFGTLAHYPPGHQRHFLHKALAGVGDAAPGNGAGQ